MPEPMKKLTVITLRDFEEETLEGLGGLGVLHLKKVEGLEFLGLKPEALRKKREYEDLYSKFNLLRKRLGVWEFPEAEGPAKIPEAELRRYIEGCERRLDELLSKINDEREMLKELDERKRELQILRDQNVEVGDLGKFQDKFVKAGLISRGIVPKLDKHFLQSKFLEYNIVGVSSARSFIIISGNPEVEKQVTNALASFNFKEFVFPKSVSKATREALREVEENILEVKQKIRNMEEKRKKIRQEFAKKLTTIEYNILKGFFQRVNIDLEKMRELLSFKSESPKEKEEYERLYERFNLLRKRLGVWEFPEAEGPAKIPEAELRRYIEGCERRLDELLSKINDAKENLRQLEERKKKLEILRDNGVEVGELGRSQDRFVRAGLISKDLAPKLDKYFSSLKYLTYKASPVSPLDSFILVIGMEEAEEWILSILSLFKFREFIFPPSVPKETERALIEVDGELKNAEERITKIEDQREELKRSFMEKMSAIGPHLRDYIRLTEAQSLILRSESVSGLQGWIPAAEAPAVKRFLSDLKAETKGCITFTLEDPLPDEKPPTLVKTPRIIKPFSILTRMLGIPDYKEIDPTVISTILWIVMFGIMFPDVGQGLLIIAIGTTLAFVVKKRFFGLNLKTIGKLLIGLGISAAVFGALFGEVFLFEVQPLWLRPIDNVWFMLKTVIIFGVAQIFLGLTFGLINNLKKGDKIEALMGEHSVASLVLFSGLLALIVRFWIARDLSCFLHWTIFIPLIGVAMILTKSSAKKMAGREDEEGIMESIGSTIDMFISFLCNTASYARLAGFCLAHVALAEVCQVLLVKSTALGIAGLVLMNSLALTIELMVVMIQALRLLYYEFSTKFYSGTGIRYSPLILERGKV